MADGKLFDLTGQVAMVTGTSRGLGQYLARALARAGADLVITSRHQATLAPFQAEIEALGRRALPLELDVRDPQSITRMVAAAHAHFGRLDIEGECVQGPTAHRPPARPGGQIPADPIGQRLIPDARRGSSTGAAACGSSVL